MLKSEFQGLLNAARKELSRDADSNDYQTWFFEKGYLVCEEFYDLDEDFVHALENAYVFAHNGFQQFFDDHLDYIEYGSVWYVKKRHVDDAL